MTNQPSNPYAVLESQISSGSDRKPSLIRGMILAVPFGTVGFVLMYVSVSVSKLWRERVFPSPQSMSHLLIDLHELSLWPSLICAMLFGFAAVLNFTAPSQLGMFRALSYASGYAILAVALTMAASVSLGIDQRDYADPWEWTRKAILFAFFALLIAIHTAMRCRRRESDAVVRNAEQNSKPQLPMTGVEKDAQTQQPGSHD